MIVPLYIAEAVPAYAIRLAVLRNEADDRTLPRWERDAARLAAGHLETHLRAMAETLIALNDRPAL